MTNFVLPILFFLGLLSTPDSEINNEVFISQPVEMMVSDLVITEIMYNPSGADSDWEWIEVYNKGNTAIDLSGYVLDDNSSTQLGAANIASGILEPQQSAVLFDSAGPTDQEFRDVWGNVNLIPVTNWSSLGNGSGDSIGLWDSFENYDDDNQTQTNTIEQVVYKNDEDFWPDDDGKSSIFLIALDVDNTIGSNWALSSVNEEDVKSPLFDIYISTRGDIGSPGVLISADTDAPVIECPEMLEVNTDEGLCSSEAAPLLPSATDNVSTEFTFNATRSDGLELEAPFSAGDTFISWTATDEAGNTSLPCEQIIRVNDVELPLAIAQNITVELDENGLAFIAPEDLDNIETPSFDNCGIDEFMASRIEFSCADVETPVLVEFSVVDINGNTSAVSNAEVTVLDKLKPTFTCGVDIITISSDGEAVPLEDVVEPIVIDNCDTAPILTYSRSDEQELSAPFQVGTTTIAWQAVDASGNVEECIQTIVIDFVAAMDNDILVFSIPGQLGETSIDSNLKTIALLMPIGTDVTQLVPSFIISDNATSVPELDDTVDFTEPLSYIVTAQDGSEQEWVVTVNVEEDTIPPTFEVKGNTEDFVTELEVGDSYIVGEISNVVDENVTVSEIIGDDLVDTSEIGGPFLVSYRVSDGVNVTTITETVTVINSSQENLSVTSFTLINAITNEDLFTLEEGMEIDSDDLPTLNLDIRANVTDDVQSVRLSLGGEQTNLKTENVFPYALYGDSPAGDYYGNEFSLGDYSVSATAFSEKQLAGDSGNTLLLNFKIIEVPRPFIFSLVRENSFYENITIPIEDGEMYNYTVDWGDGTIDTSLTGPASHTYSNPNQEYKIEISGVFPRIYFGQLVPNDEFDTTFTIYQWGDQQWTSFEDAFGLETTKMVILAEDTPNLSQAPSFKGMFAYAFDLDGTTSMHTWDVSDIEDMSFMFWRSDKIDADITGWDVSNVKNMSHMFSDSKFNQNIANWDVANVTDMSAMFMRSGFNQNIGNWDVSNVTNMSSMFFLTPFNQDIGNWNVENVTDMASMFSGASFFNQDIGNWNVSKVTSMKEMFFGVEDFDQNLGSWIISSLEDAENFLSDTGLSIENYDATLIGWSNLSQLPSELGLDARGIRYCLGEQARQKLMDDFGWVITDGGKALNCNPCPTAQITLNTQQQVDDFATTYDASFCTFEGGILIEGSDITNLDGLSSLTYIEGYLNIINTSVTNIDALSALVDVRISILIEGNSNLTNIDGLSSLTSLSTLIISDNTVLTNIGGLSSLSTISVINITGNTVLDNIDGLTALTLVGGDIVIQNNASLKNLDGLSSLTSIGDNFSIINNASLTNIDGLSSFVFIDNDLIIESNPMLENVDGLSSLDATGLSLSIQSNSALTNLDGLSSLANMGGDLSIINNGNLTDLSGLANLINVMGKLNISENVSLSNCAIEAVCNSDTVVGGTVTIFGNTGDCSDLAVATAACVPVEVNADLLDATYLQGFGNPSPTGPILRVEEGNRETYLKFDLSSFSGPITEATLQMQVASDPGNGDLEVFLGSDSDWTETGLNGGNKPLAVGSPLATVSGIHGLGQTKTWTLDVSNIVGGDNITLIIKHSNGNDVAFASDETAQAPQLIIRYNDGPQVQRPFITTWKTDNPGMSNDNQITIPTFPGEIYDYTVDWGDGTSDSGLTGDMTHTYETPGTYTVSISGDFPRIYFNGNLLSIGDKEKIIEVNQWGDIAWTSMANAFASCLNLDISSTDVPDLSNVEDMSGMFAGCVRMQGNGSFNEWNTTNVRDMSGLFAGTDFNYPIGNWNTSNVVNMSFLFAQSLFNQAIGDWDVSNVTDMGSLFEFSSFNQEVGDWDVSNVRNMDGLFLMTGFNRDISKWDVSSVTSMNNMFNQALFDQDISEWDVSNVTSMRGMFEGIAGLSQANYDALLKGWSMLQLQNGVPFEGGTSQYCLGEAARQKLIDDFGWIISDSGKVENCDIPMEGVADLIDGTYLQGFGNPSPTGPILRVEEGNRETYLKFDMSAFSGPITNAQLTMQVASDPGNGTLEVFLASNSNWTETGLNGGNKPSAVGASIATISGIHSIGQTKAWNLDVSNLIGGGEITLIVKHSNGNDVAFASDETNQPPQLTITSGGSGVSSKSTNTLSLSPNPASYETSITLKEPGELVKVYVYDVLGRMVGSYEGESIENDSSYVLDVQSLPTGTYYVKSYDEKGNAYQKQMLIKK